MFTVNYKNLRFSQISSRGTPSINDPSTILGKINRRPATIVRVSEDGKKIGVQRDRWKHGRAVKCTKNKIEWFTKRKNSIWCREGKSIYKGQRLMVGEKHYFNSSIKRLKKDKINNP